MGLPSDREQYIHRLGRTGRKGKEGQGVLLLAPWEEFFLSTIKDLPLSKAPVHLIDPDTKKKVSLQRFSSLSVILCLRVFLSTICQHTRQMTRVNSFNLFFFLIKYLKTYVV